MSDDLILTALEEAALEVRFRLEDVIANGDQEYLYPDPGNPERRAFMDPIVTKSIKGTLKKIRTAIVERKRELSIE